MKKTQTLNYETHGSNLAVRVAGDRQKPALLLIHGFPSSSNSFRNVIDSLAEDCFVIAPDLPGFGGSDRIKRPSFSRFATLIGELLEHLKVESFHLYLHDYGAAVGLHLAMRSPRHVRSLIIQNANAHESGMGPSWAATKRYWKNPTSKTKDKATAHLNFEGIRYQYVGDIPDDIAARIDPQLWKDDWRIMSLPGHLKLQQALVLDYRNHVARFRKIKNYLRRAQPPALMLWGRHDVFFDIKEIVSWMEDLPRMESHILDGPHFLLETHAEECVELMRTFIKSLESAP